MSQTRHALAVAALLGLATLATSRAPAQEVAALTIANATGDPAHLTLALDGQPFARGGRFPSGTNTALTLVRPGAGQSLVAAIGDLSATSQISTSMASTTLVIVHGRHALDPDQLAALRKGLDAPEPDPDPGTAEAPPEEETHDGCDDRPDGCDDRRDGCDDRPSFDSAPATPLPAAFTEIPRSPIAISTFDLTPLLPPAEPGPDAPPVLLVLSFLGPEHGELTIAGEPFAPRPATITPAPAWTGGEVVAKGESWRAGLPGGEEASEPGTVLLLILHPDPTGLPLAQGLILRPLPGTSQ